MLPPSNPALSAFLAEAGAEVRFAQVLIRRSADLFHLCHSDDAAAAVAEQLASTTLDQLRELVTATAAGAFRPNKAAPNLRRGWRLEVPPDRLLEALEILYPGAVADWFAARQSPPPVQNYREFTERQTGMYRVTTQLDDAQAAEVIRACCDARLCLRRRLWTVGQLDADAPAAKSGIPCLEPCALLLELARRAQRLNLDERTTLHLGEGDMMTLAAAIDLAATSPLNTVREGDSSHPANPRRLLMLKEKLLPYLPVPKGGSGSEE
jgi:hypothetical protein